MSNLEFYLVTKVTVNIYLSCFNIFRLCFGMFLSFGIQFYYFIPLLLTKLLYFLFINLFTVSNVSLYCFSRIKFWSVCIINSTSHLFIKPTLWRFVWFIISFKSTIRKTFVFKNTLMDISRMLLMETQNQDRFNML